MESEYTVNRRNGLATTSLVLGIAPICTAAVVFLTGFRLVNLITVGITVLFSLAAIITGAISLRQIHKQGSRGKGLAITGITLGVLTAASILLLIWVFLSLMGFFGGKGI